MTKKKKAEKQTVKKKAAKKKVKKKQPSIHSAEEQLTGKQPGPESVKITPIPTAGKKISDFEKELGRAEADTFNRVWPGNVAVGLLRLAASGGLDFGKLSAIVPPNTAFAHTLLRMAEFSQDPAQLFSDFTQTVISGLYDARTGSPLPQGTLDLLAAAAPDVRWDRLRALRRWVRRVRRRADLAFDSVLRI